MPTPISTGDAPLRDCWTTWKPSWNAKSPPNGEAAIRQALDDYQPLCNHCRLAMRRHHRYVRAIATGYGEVRLQIPVFRCGQCRRTAGGMALPGDKCATSGFPKNRDIAISLAAQGRIELCPRRKPGGLRQEYRLPVGAEGAFGRAGAAAGRNAGNGRFVYANP